MKYLILFTIFFAGVLNSNSQTISPELISPAGDHFSKNGVGSLSWSIGEVVTETLTNGSLIITQGFHQTYKPTSSNVNVPLFEAKVYPNPTSDWINVKSKIGGVCLIKIIDTHGKLALPVINSNQSNNMINLSDLSSGTYILQIINKEFQSEFKVIKQ